MLLFASDVCRSSASRFPPGSHHQGQTRGRTRCARSRRGAGWSQPEPVDWLHGYIPGRRRGRRRFSSDRFMTSRLERLGLKSLTAFHDLTNAFGSGKWEVMDRAVAALLGPNALLGQQRCRLATTTILRKGWRHHTQDW